METLADSSAYTTYSICRQWDRLNPIFSEMDGGSEDLRTASNDTSGITLAALDGPPDGDDSVFDGGQELLDTLGRVVTDENTPADSQVDPILSQQDPSISTPSRPQNSSQTGSIRQSGPRKFRHGVFAPAEFIAEASSQVAGWPEGMDSLGP